MVRLILVVALVVCAGFAGWSWFRPYEWAADSAARCKIAGVQVRSDHSFFWVDVHLRVSPGGTHDLSKPVRLSTAAGKELEPADTMLGSKDQVTTDLWFKFWLEPADLSGPLSLRINDGKLIVKAKPGIPSLGATQQKFFPTNHW